MMHFYGMGQADVMRRHLQEQVQMYGEQALVNLVNQKGHEKPIKEAYERYVAEVCRLTSCSVINADLIHVAEHAGRAI